MDIPSWCRVGQKVVALDNWTPRAEWQLAPLVKNQQYTIRDVRVAGTRVGIRLMEVHNPKANTLDAGYTERYYHVALFAPVTDTKFESDIAMFKDILLNAHEYRDITEHV